MNDQLLDPDAPTLALQDKLKVSPKGLPFVIKKLQIPSCKKPLVASLFLANTRDAAVWNDLLNATMIDRSAAGSEPLQIHLIPGRVCIEISILRRVRIEISVPRGRLNSDINC